MREAKASPVPNSKEPERFCCSITAIRVLLMVNLNEFKRGGETRHLPIKVQAKVLSQ
jgi:hypothetical protein